MWNINRWSGYKKYNLKCLHSQIGYVPQEPSLFEGAFLENLIYGLSETELDTNTLNNKDKYEKEIKWSLNISQEYFVFDESKFPLGLDTIVGSKGVKLSEGQKQRIVIARTMKLFSKKNYINDIMKIQNVVLNLEIFLKFMLND